MPNEEESDKSLIECLCVEIKRAVIGSPDVKSCIKRVKELDLLDRVQGCDLVLEVEMLLELTQKGKKNR